MVHVLAATAMTGVLQVCIMVHHTVLTAGVGQEGAEACIGSHGHDGGATTGSGGN